MDSSVLKELQKKEIEILKEVLLIIEKNHFKYFLLGGTLLGAVRHKGFIPWDDDIDIGMPRNHYDRFIEKCIEELPANYKVVYYKTQGKESNDLGYSCQIVDISTEIELHIANKTMHSGVWIDIFPLDGMPDHLIARKIHCIHLLYRRMRMQFSMFDEHVHLARKNRPWYEKFLIKLYQVTKIGSGSDTYEMMEKIDHCLKKYPYEKSNYLINFMGAWKLKEMFDKKVYGEGKEYDFEGLSLIGPQNADFVLRQMYGDYMTPLTDDEEKMKHHNIVVKKI